MLFESESHAELRKMFTPKIHPTESWFILLRYIFPFSININQTCRGIPFAYIHTLNVLFLNPNWPKNIVSTGNSSYEYVNLICLHLVEYV